MTEYAELNSKFLAECKILDEGAVYEVSNDLEESNQRIIYVLEEQSQIDANESLLGELVIIKKDPSYINLVVKVDSKVQLKPYKKIRKSISSLVDSNKGSGDKANE